MSEKEVWTIKKIIDRTEEYFKDHKIEWPHLEAEILLAHSLNLPRIQLYVQFERVLKEEELAEFRKLVLRRSKREPIAYITGTQPFMTLEFKVNPSVLIPRPETEKLVEAVIEAAKNIKDPVIADIGTGSGAIAVCLAKYIQTSKVYAADSSKEAIEVAKANAEKHNVQGRCTFLVGNLFEPLKEKFDLIVSNPPYVRSADIDSLEPEISEFEPRVALDGGEDGLDHYRKIIPAAASYLKKEGSLLIEIGAGQADEIKKLISLSEKYESSETQKDLSGIKRVIAAKIR